MTRRSVCLACGCRVSDLGSAARPAWEHDDAEWEADHAAQVGPDSRITRY